MESQRIEKDAAYKALSDDKEEQRKAF